MATTTDVTTSALRTCASCGAAMPADAAFCPSCGVPVARATPAPAFPVPAGLLARGAAFLIDYMLLGIVWSMVLGLVSAFAGDAVLGLGGVALLAAGQLYWARLESSRWQASIGKMALSLVVVGVDGARLTLNRALTRSALSAVPIVAADLCLMAGAVVPGALLMLTLVPGAVLMAPFTARRQALHDRLTGTMVARRPHA